MLSTGARQTRAFLSSQTRRTQCLRIRRRMLPTATSKDCTLPPSSPMLRRRLAPLWTAGSPSDESSAREGVEESRAVAEESAHQASSAPAAAPSSTTGVPPLFGPAPPPTWMDYAVGYTTMFLVFFSVPYVIPFLPLILLVAHLQTKSLWPLAATAAWLYETCVSPGHHHAPWPGAFCCNRVAKRLRTNQFSYHSHHQPLTAAVELLRYVFWGAWKPLFRFELIAEAELDPNKLYVFGSHPHGVFPLAQWLTIPQGGARC